MNEETGKAKPRARRLEKTQTAIVRQVKIATMRPGDTPHRVVDQPGRLRKHHAMDCGNPQCYLCGNPRHNAISKGESVLTIQEKKFLDIEKEGTQEVGANDCGE